MPASRLHLELTESVFADDRNNVISVLRGLRERGLKISLDDFGTGFSCLAYLGRLPIDQIKIDKSFVEKIHIDTCPIVRTIITTAQTFGLEVIGEGVETIDQAQSLFEMGAQYLQGYFFSNALSPKAICEWLLKKNLLAAGKVLGVGRSASV